MAFQLENASFKSVEGGYLFFPYGIFTSGYFVGEEKKAQFGRFIRGFYIAGFLLVVLNGLWSWWIGGAMLALLLANYFFVIRHMLAGVPQTKERMTYMESQAGVAKVLPTSLIYVLAGCGVLMTAGAIIYTVMALRSGDASLPVGLFAILLFGGGLFAAINIIRLKRLG